MEFYLSVYLFIYRLINHTANNSRCKPTQGKTNWPSAGRKMSFEIPQNKL